MYRVWIPKDDGAERRADDFVMGFQHKEEAERFLKELKDRFANHGLDIHNEKPQLIEFGRFAEANRQERGVGKPEHLTFWGLRTYAVAEKTIVSQFVVRQSPNVSGQNSKR